MSFLSRSLWATLKHLSSLHGAQQQPVNDVTQPLPRLRREGVFTIFTEEKREGWAQCWGTPSPGLTWEDPDIQAV